MNNHKQTLVTAFALFSLFFGAGNLIFPPLLGFQSGNMWWLVALGFCLSAVLIPILGILAHAKLQGTIFDFGKKVSPTFSYIYSVIIYIICIALPSPRTASVTHEIAVLPFFDTPYILTSIIYFILVFIFVMNRSKILDLLGKFLTPTIILILIAIIAITLFSTDFNFGKTVFESPFTHGIQEGYQTFDAIAAIVVGGVIIVSINLKNQHATYEDKKVLIRKAGWLAGLSLFLIYLGLILTGALFYDDFDATISRTALLSGISLKTLGNTANLLVSILVSLACFTTAVGVVAGTSDFAKYLFKGSDKAYLITAILGCLFGILMGQFNVNMIINIAIPALMFIYPITIILILLNVVPDKFATVLVFRTVVITTIIFSIPDFLESIKSPLFDFDSAQSTAIGNILAWIPLQKYSVGWVLPALLSFIVVNVISSTKNKEAHNPN